MKEEVAIWKWKNPFNMLVAWLIKNMVIYISILFTILYDLQILNLEFCREYSTKTYNFLKFIINYTSTQQHTLPYHIEMAWS
jgi:small-conductance mechanosensitive channel